MRMIKKIKISKAYRDFADLYYWLDDTKEALDDFVLEAIKVSSEQLLKSFENCLDYITFIVNKKNDKEIKKKFEILMNVYRFTKETFEKELPFRIHSRAVEGSNFYYHLKDFLKLIKEDINEFLREKSLRRQAGGELKGDEP